MVESADEGFADLEASLRSALRHPACLDLRQVVGRRPCHLVGGFLRDTALGHPARDLDVIVAGGGADVASLLAARVGSRSIRVGGERFAAYRVMRHGLPIDIWDRGRVDLEADLRRRDLTIHAIAVDLETGDLEDPLSGLGDLSRRRLVAASARAFEDDPLRVLRLCRFFAQLYGFSLDPTTRSLAEASVAALSGVARERLRVEIERTLEGQGPATAVEHWIDWKIAPESWLGVCLDSSSRRTLRAGFARGWQVLDRVARDLPSPTDPFCTRLALLLSWLEKTVHLASDDGLQILLRKGLLTKSRYKRVSRLLDAGPPPATGPQQRWYLHRVGELWPSALSLAAALVGRGSDDRSSELASMMRLATERADEIFDPPVLVSGPDLQECLSLAPGPEMGRVLTVLRRRQIEGQIQTREEALAAAARMLGVEMDK